MHSLKLSRENSCQNFLVHPKCMLDVSTKFHGCQPIHPPWECNANFSLGLRFESLKLKKKVHPPHPHPFTQPTHPLTPITHPNPPTHPQPTRPPTHPPHPHPYPLTHSTPLKMDIFWFRVCADVVALHSCCHVVALVLCLYGL